ncbi:hypothetical protein ACHAXN_004517 [Cyclotella atomus]
MKAGSWYFQLNMKRFELPTRHDGYIIMGDETRQYVNQHQMQRINQQQQNPQLQTNQVQMDTQQINQQQQPYYTESQQQQQFEQNVQSMFGIGQSETNYNTNGPNDPFFYDNISNTQSTARDVNTSSFFTALCLNAVLFVVLMTCYELFKRCFPTVYERKKGGASSSSTMLPPFDSRVPFGWVPGVLAASWSTVRNAGGLDSYMFLRYVRLCFRISFTSAIWGMLILWPIYASSDGGAEGWYFLSMANLSQGSQALWAPVIFMWMQTFYVLFLMDEEYNHYLECRVDFLARGGGNVNSTQHMYSLIVERIPHELKSDRALYDYFNRLFPGKVHSTAVVLNLPDLERVSQQRNRILRRLEKSMVWLKVTGKRPYHVVGRKRIRCCGIESSPIFSGLSFRRQTNSSPDAIVYNSEPRRGERVDSISYYSHKLTAINEKLARMQHEKIELALRGNDQVRASQWISHAIDRVSTAAESTLGSSDENGLISGFQLHRRKPLLLTILDRLGVDFIYGGLHYIQQNIDEVVDSVVGATMSSTGFITFKDLQTVTCAVRTPLFDRPGVLVVSMAPEPRDIIWDNAHVNLGWSKGREFTANMLLGLGAILWSIPVASIQALATADQIATVPGMFWISTLHGGAIAGFVNGYLPVVLLLTIIMILPLVFHAVALHYEDRKTQSDIQKSIIGRFFYYQLANIYISVTAGSILDSLSDIVEHPSNILAILGKSLPNVVGYFATFIMTKILAGLPLILLRSGALIRAMFIRLCFREKYLTQSELEEARYPDQLYQIRYGFEYPNLLLVIVICFTYSCISPVILPVGAAFFAGSWLVYKNQILTVYKPSYESGGTMFPMACHRTLIGLVCGQLTLIGYSIMREGFYQALTMFPLPLISIKMMTVFKNMYVIPGACISIERAVEIDTRRQVDTAFSSDVYRQPVLTEKLSESRSLLRTNVDDDFDASGGPVLELGVSSGKIV